MSKKHLPNEWNPEREILKYAIFDNEAAKDIAEARNTLRKLERSRERARTFLEQLHNKMPQNIRLSARIQDEDPARVTDKTLVYQRTDEGWEYYGSIVISGEAHRFFANQVIRHEDTIVLIDTNSGWGITPTPNNTLEISPFGIDDDKESVNAVKIHAETLQYLEAVDPTRDCTYFNREWIHA